MRLREHTAAACLFILIICATASVVAAQEFMQPPFVPPPPGTPSLLAGRFYFQAGARFRAVNTFEVQFQGSPLRVVASPGTVPFGPTTAGNFGAGTGVAGFDGTTGDWIYDNGSIFVFPTVGPDGVHSGVTCENAGPPPTTDLCYEDTAYLFDLATNPTTQLGRRPVVFTGAPCCGGVTGPSNVGSFFVNDPSIQFNSTTFAGTTAITFDLLLTDSMVFTASGSPSAPRVFDPKVWSPTFETGFQLYDFFDLFYGFSWFNTKESTAKNNVRQAQFSRTLIRDTFPFFSSDTSSTADSFNSAVEGDPVQEYRIWPNSQGRGFYPNRQFIDQSDVSIPLENIQETTSYTGDFNVYESRWGGRTWLPLFGMGRLSANLGVMLSAVYMDMKSANTYVASGSSGVVVPGTVLGSFAASHKDWRPCYGAFVGGDLEFMYGSFSIRGAADYAWATVQTYQLMSVETQFSPGGFSATVSGGVWF